MDSPEALDGATSFRYNSNMSAFSRRLQSSVGTPGSGDDLQLSRIPWEGGPAYWSQFSNATASGWTNDSFFPISVYLSSANPTHVASLQSAGINTYMSVEHSPGVFPMSNITSQGMFAMAGGEWTPAEVGSDPGVVGWFIADEADMGMAYPGDQYEALAAQQADVDARKALADGRFTWANYGNGILRTFWSNGVSLLNPPLTVMHDFVRMVDGASADKYTYTSPDVLDIIDGVHDAPDWPNGVLVPRAYSYGWQAGQMARFQDPANMRPIWTFVETARPYLFETGALTIQPDQIEGAVWSALIHEARGIAYFQHNNDATYGGNYSIVDIPGVHAKLTDINSKVLSLAPVLNTQSYWNTTVDVNGFTYYRYSFGNDTDTMLKTYAGSCYIFAALGMGHSTGSKTFTLPAGVSGTSVTVVGEGRTIPILAGEFSDDFTYEYTHHVYQIDL